MCGEKSGELVGLLIVMGSPPHVRGKERRLNSQQFQQGITPACAGKREWNTPYLLPSRDHPRMCGEKTKKIP